MRKLLPFLLLFLPVRHVFAQEEYHFIDQTYDLQKVREIIEYLASDELGGRDTPSKGLELAAKYIGHRFAEYGIKPPSGSDNYFQPVRLSIRNQPDSLSVQIGGIDFSNSTNAVYISGNYGKHQATCQWLDSSAFSKSPQDFSHRVVLFFNEDEPGQNPREVLEQSMKMKAFAQAHKADGIIEIFDKDHPLWERLTRYYGRNRIELVTGEKEFLHIMLRDEKGSIRNKADELSNADMRIFLTAKEADEFTSDNVIGVVEGSDPILKNEYILCTAHYDHVGTGRPDASGDSIYNGARDNAIGVMSVVMAAENLARNPAKRSVIFVLFTGEEKGLLGSQYFAKHPPVSLKDIIFCLNSDGGGYNDTTIATVIGMRRLETYQVFESACISNQLNAFGGTDNSQFLFYNSDNVVFSREGIPSVTFSPGFREMDAEILKYYHQPSDEAGSLDFTYVEKFTRAFGTALRSIADSEVRLFWKEGDEFYDKAQELYEEQ